MQTIALNITDLIILFGAAQGFILAVILSTTKRLRRTSNLYLAVLLVVCSFLNIDNVFQAVIQKQYAPLTCLPIYFFTLIPISLYFFVRYLTQPAYVLTKKDRLLFLLPLAEGLHQVLRFGDYLLTNRFETEGLLGHSNVTNVFEGIGIAGTAYVLLISIRQLGHYQKSLYDHFAEVEGKNLKWLKNTLLSSVLLTVIWISVIYFDYIPHQEDALVTKLVWIGLSVLICWIGFSMIIRQGLLDSAVFGVIALPNEEEKKSTELSTKATQHYQTILTLLEQEEIYRDSELSLTILAEKANLSRSYVSQIINQKRQQNFFELINSYRVEAVKQAMQDATNDHLSILGIAQNAGFKSKSTFNAVFKKMTGMTPSQYRKKVEQQ